MFRRECKFEQKGISMRLMLKVLAVALLSLAGCDKPKSSTSDKPKPLIAVSLLTLTNPFFKEIADTMQAEGAKHGYEVLITSGEFDPAKQKDQVKDFLVRKATA